MSRLGTQANLPRPSELDSDDSSEFQTGQIMTIVGGHFVNDGMSAFVPALLPLLIEKLALTYTLAGILQSAIRLPAILNPFIGYFADRVSLRYFVILAPAVTGTLISVMGLAPGYWPLFFLLLAVGISSASFHAPAPAMVGRLSGDNINRAMGIFMASGELGRTLGPVAVVALLTVWPMEGLYRVAIVSWATSLVMYLRLRTVPARTPPNTGLREMLPVASRLFIPLVCVLLARAFLAESMAFFLPTYLTEQGYVYGRAALSLTLYDGAGVGGSLISGFLADRFGKRQTIFVSMLVAVLFMFVFLFVSGLLITPVLIAIIGFSSLMSIPLMLAMVQEHLPQYRALANGMFVAMAFLVGPTASTLIGVIADRTNLHTAFVVGAVITLVGLPVVLALPSKPAGPSSG